MGFMMLFWAVVLFLLVWFAVQTVRGPGWSDRGESPRFGGPSAAEILRERYARGEIDRDTFLRMLEDLRGDSATR
jgi:putative membrane protein